MKIYRAHRKQDSGKFGRQRTPVSFSLPSQHRQLVTSMGLWSVGDFKNELKSRLGFARSFPMQRNALRTERAHLRPVHRNILAV